MLLIGALSLLIGFTTGALTQERSESPAPAQPPKADIICTVSDQHVSCAQQVGVASDREGDLHPLGASSVAESDLRIVGPDFATQLAFARELAGTAIDEASLYVDGLPAPAVISPSSIARITVNGDPMSAEFSSVGQVRIDVDSQPPDRRWNVEASTPSLHAGGGSRIADAGTPHFRNTAVAVSGPLPWQRLSFSLSGTLLRAETQPVMASADSQTLSAAALRNRTRNDAVDAEIAYVSRQVVARFVWSAQKGVAEHLGVGAFNGTTTGLGTRNSSDSFRATWRVIHGALVQRGGLIVTGDGSIVSSDSSIQETVVTAQFRTGSDIALDRHREHGFTFKDVVDAPAARHPWTIGLQADREAIIDNRATNPLGRLQLPSVDAQSGVLTVTRGIESAAFATTDSSVFAEERLWNPHRGTVRVGLRADWQDGDGVVMEPRLASAFRAAGFRLTGGMGLFVGAWTPDLFLNAVETQSASTLVFRNVDRDALPALDDPGRERLQTVIDRAFGRRRDFVMRGGLQRRIGWIDAGIEHSWTSGASLPGAVRLREPAGLVDLIASNRSLRRNETDAQLRARWRGQSITVHYARVRSIDNGLVAGAPAAPGDLNGEWGASSGVPRHALGFAAMLALPRQVRGAVSFDARNGVPFNIITGRDVGGLATFTDRGGLPRNSGVLPPARTLSVYAMRTVRSKRWSWAAVDVGVRADNVTDHRNVTSVGRVIGSPLFGVPLAAAPGRSIRVWISAGR